MVKAGELWKIEGPTFTALLQFNNHGHVWWAAPSLAKLQRLPEKRVREYCTAQGWKMLRAIPDGWEEVSPTESRN